MPSHDPTRCRQGRLCVDAAVAPGFTGRAVREPALVLDGLGLCPACSRAAWWVAYDAPGHVAELEAMIADPLRKPATTSDPTMPRGTQTERPCELNLQADALARHLVLELCVWAEQVDDHLELRDDDTRTIDQRWSEADAGQRLQPRALAAADLLLSNWDLLLALPSTTYRTHGGRPLAPDTLDEHHQDAHGLVTARDGASFACALLALDHQIAVQCGRGPSRTEREKGSCPHCGADGTVLRTPPMRAGGPSPLRCEHCHRGITEHLWDAHRTPAWPSVIILDAVTSGDAIQVGTPGDRNGAGAPTGAHA